MVKNRARARAPFSMSRRDFQRCLRAHSPHDDDDSGSDGHIRRGRRVSKARRADSRRNRRRKFVNVHARAHAFPRARTDASSRTRFRRA